MRIKTLVEAEIKPGERKGISLKISKLEKMLKKINDYQESAASMHNMKVPDSVAAEYAKVQQGIYDEIEKLNLEKDQFKGEKNNLPVKFYNLMQGIAKNCTQIVKAYTETNPDFKANKAKVFYRGIKSSEDAVYGKPFDERRVMTSSSELSNIFNNRMKEAGFEARRDNSSFVSADKNQASGYGKLYVMFPRDGFSFSWSRNTKDLILDRGSYPKMVDYEKLLPLKDAILKNKDKLSSYEYDFSFSDLFGEWNLDGTLRAAKLAIDNGIISKDLEPLTQLENIITPESLAKGFELDQSDLTGAIESEKEVYIRGAYYAVAETYMKEIMKFLELQVYPQGKPKKIVPGEYEIGDRVTIKNKNSNYHGQSGEVQYVYANYGEISVLLDGNNWTNDFKFKDVKHETGDESPDFEEGEWIEVTDEKSADFGTKGKISFVYDTGKLEVFLNGGKYGDFMPNQVKAIENPTPASSEEPSTPIDLEIGDEVEITGGPHIGQVGKVSYVWSVTNNVDVIVPELDNAEISVKKGEIKKLDAKTSEPEEPDVDSPDFNKVNLDWEPEPEVAAPASEKLKAGDKVKVTGFHYGGHTGTVEEVLKTGMVQVALDTTGTSKVFYANELAKIESAAEPKAETPKFELGDAVKITKGHDAGKTGTIAHISSYFDEAAIKLSDGTMSYDIPLEALEKTEEPAQAEPEPAVPEIDIENFTVGKPVKITKGEHAGKVGTLDYVSKVLANADVMTPHGSMLNNIPLTDLQVLDFPVKNKAPEAPAPMPALKDVPEVKALMNKALSGNKQVSYEELDQVVPKGATGQQIEELLNYFDQFGINVYEEF